MKFQYKASLIALGVAAALTSCSEHDIIGDVAEVGQEVPAAYWELGSTACKAGESFTFQGKYRAPEGKTIAYSEVWYTIERSESAAATVKLAGPALSYTKTYTSTDAMRAYQPIAHFDHSLAEWDGYEFIIKGEVPVSRTLSPVSWNDAPTWDQARFDSYYPAEFTSEFNAEVVNLLTKDSTYYNSLRTVYMNHPFTNEQFTAVNAKYNVSLPDNIDMSKDDQGASEKSTLWFSTTEASDAAIVGYYYTTVDASGNTVVHEIGKDVPTLGDDGKMRYEGKTCYPVYKSSPWVFCRYNDDLGAIISTVRAQYMPAFKELLQSITFDQWIYDSANKVYKIEFTRNYLLNAQFRVYDTEGEEGIATDIRQVAIN